jgi:type II secretory pathway pseudopilin PulG
MEGLSKLTDSILPIIVLAVIAGVRIITMVRRQARNRDQSQKQEDGAQSFQDEYRDPASPVTIEEAEREDPDDEFSAWSLSVNDDEPVPAVPSKPAELPAADSKNVSVFTALSSTSSVPVSREIPAWLLSPSQPPEPRPTEAPVSVTEGLETRVPAAAAGDGGLLGSRIRSLPPLQQGIVWAEILGTPKGL